MLCAMAECRNSCDNILDMLKSLRRLVSSGDSVRYRYFLLVLALEIRFSGGQSDELPVEGFHFKDACSSTFCCTSSCPDCCSGVVLVAMSYVCSVMCN